MYRQKTCVKKLFSLIDNTVSELQIDAMSKQEIYSVVAQIMYVIYILDTHGWVHGDFHSGNIGVKHTDETFVTMELGSEKINVPTFGRLIQAIDFGGVLHKDFFKKRYQRQDIFWRH